MTRSGRKLSKGIIQTETWRVTSKSIQHREGAHTQPEVGSEVGLIGNNVAKVSRDFVNQSKKLRSNFQYDFEGFPLYSK
jgi:hypothetical protein